MLKEIVKSAVNKIGFQVSRLPESPGELPDYGDYPDKEHYLPNFTAWLALPDFRKYFEIASSHTLLNAQGCYNIYSFLSQALFLEGDVWECGVYKGGTAALMANMIRDKAPQKNLLLFDTFEGMPKTNEEFDWHKEGDFADTSIETVKKFVGNEEIARYHQGFIPDTFKGLEGAKICFAHIDVDIYQSVHDSIAFIWPRLSIGGFVIFDDYGQPSCAGARKAVDEYFSDKPVVPYNLPEGKALVIKSL